MDNNANDDLESEESMEEFYLDSDDSIKDPPYLPEIIKTKILRPDLTDIILESNEETNNNSNNYYCKLDDQNIVPSNSSTEHVNLMKDNTNKINILSDIIIQPAPEQQDVIIAEHGEKKLSKKKKRNSMNWKRNINKNLCEHGEEYRDVSGKLKKRRQPNLKNCQCKFKCSNKISDTQRIIIHEHFWKLSNQGKLHFYNKNVKRQFKRRLTVKGKDSSRLYSYKYFFHISDDLVSETAIRVCKNFFLNTLDVSQRRISYFFENKRQEVTGNPTDIMQGKHIKKKISEENKNKVKEHINSIPRIASHYCRKRTNKEYFESTLNFSRLYELYREWCEQQQEIPVKKSYYRAVFNNDFNIAFQKPKSDRCDLCEENKIRERNEENYEPDVKFLEHAKSKEISKQYRDADRQNNDESVAIVCFDLENVFALPISNISCFFYSKKLNTYNLTGHCNLNKNGYCAIWSEGMHGRKGLDIASALIKILTKIVQNFPNVSEIVLWSDSCVPQNKNSIMSLALKNFMFEFPQIKQITQKFSEPGHGLVQEVDNLHSQIEKRIKGMEIFSPLGLLRTLRSVNQRKPLIVFHMQNTDFKDYEKASKTIDFKSIPYASVKQLKYIRDQPTKIYYKKLHHDAEFVEVTLNFATVTRNKKGFFILPKIERCPQTTKCLLTEDKVHHLYKLFKYMPDVDKQFIETLFYEHKNKIPTKKTKNKNREEGNNLKKKEKKENTKKSL